MLSEGVRLDFINNKIRALEDEWDKLDSQGSGFSRQQEIAKEITTLRNEKQSWEDYYKIHNGSLTEDTNNNLSTEVKNLETQLISEFPQIDILQLYLRVNGSLYIGNIKIKKEFRGQGIGRQIINRIKKFADNHGLIISLTRESEPEYKEKLRKFYKSAGFIDNKGRNRDDSLSSMFGKSMYRKPNVNEESNNKIEVPEEPGTVSIPSNYIRLYHYTKATDMDKIRKEGLKLSNARGHTYGEPDVIWSSTYKPERYPFVEFAVAINDPRISRDANIIDRETPTEVMNKNLHITFRGDILPSEFIAIHEGWHKHYRYIINEKDVVEEVLSGKLDYLINDKFPDEAKAILAIKQNFGK
jgi:GNAT superfamily N-acetyltransferase